MKRYSLAAATFAAGFIAAQGALAATQTSSLDVNASVTSVCAINSTTALAFGEVGLTGATPGQGTVAVTCTQGGLYTVGLDNGVNAVGAQRAIASGTNKLNYNLYSDAELTTAWTGTGAGLVSGTGNAQEQDLTVYGNIPTGQTLISGNGTPYTDVVQVTVTY
ncbi:MAG: spore coat protein U domain-containing protein [Rhodospirillales bacterium]